MAASTQINTKRANIARGAMITAGKKVSEKITLETMKQSFPTHSAQHNEFITALTAETVKLLNHSFEHAWTTLSTMGSFSHFIALANAFDRIEAEAEAKLADGAEPISIASSTDLSLTFPAQTLPLLSAELEHQRTLRQQLTKQTEEKAARVAKRHAEAQEKARRIQSVLSALNESEQVLDGLDMSGLQETQEKLMQRLPGL